MTTTCDSTVLGKWTERTAADDRSFQEQQTRITTVVRHRTTVTS